MYSHSCASLICWLVKQKDQRLLSCGPASERMKKYLSAFARQCFILYTWLDILGMFHRFERSLPAFSIMPCYFISIQITRVQLANDLKVMWLCCVTFCETSTCPILCHLELKCVKLIIPNLASLFVTVTVQLESLGDMGLSVLGHDCLSSFGQP